MMADHLQELATFLYEENMLRTYGPYWRNYWWPEDAEEVGHERSR